MAEQAVIEGAVNFRDLAECPAACGFPIRQGRIYRSGYLTDITEQGRQSLRGLGLRTVFDLREPDEIRSMPFSWWPETEVINLREIHPGDYDNSVMMTWGTDLTLDAARERRLLSYQRMPGEFAPVVGQLFETLARADCYPVLLHCMGGKDRTGFLCALLLSYLGADMDTVIQEYTCNADRTGAVDPNTIKKLTALYQLDQTGKESIQAMMETLPEHLVASFRVIEGCGGVENYLSQEVGLPQSCLDAVRENLLEQKAPAVPA